MKRVNIRSLSVAVVIAFALTACKSDSSTEPRIDPVGSWSGTTSQTLPFSFVVTSAGFTSLSLKYHLNGSRCSYDAEVSTGGPAVPITNNVITISGMSLGPGTTLSATGAFASSTNASGSFQISDNSCLGSTSGTWTATKR